jgi:predicted transcriptional regulator|tara:strand:+ start:201 stop:413 length:213 start_codon:yes stop_codon:yes gene_type:complete
MKTRYLQVEEKENLIRDTRNQAILNTDLEGLKAYRIQKRKFNDIEKIKCDVDDIKCDIQEIKNMIKAISR